MTETTPRQTVYRVETERLVLRCWSPEDAPVMRAALDANNQHLRPWIPFMKDEPRTLLETAQWLREIRAAFDQDQTYRFAVFDADEKNLLGENMLIDRVGADALEIGYWLDKEAVGQGIAYEACCAMLRLAFDMIRISRLDLMCPPENKASAALAAKLGFTHEATLRQRGVDSELEISDLMLWTLFADDYSGTSAVNSSFRAFDCMGNDLYHTQSDRFT